MNIRAVNIKRSIKYLPILLFLFIVGYNTLDLDTATDPLVLDSPNDPQLPTLLFVKFHKVGGTSMRSEFRNRFSKYNICADHNCSLPVARKMGDCKNRKEFRHALDEFDWVPSGAEVKTFTLLRDPAERLRSKYYYRRAGWCAKKFDGHCEAGRMSFLEWMNHSSSEPGGQGGKDPIACCEYTRVLGQMDLKKALRSLDYFDIVGITEHMERSMKEINRALGVNNHELVTEDQNNNTKAKLPWTEEERELADKLTRTDRIVYEKALKLAEGWGK